MKDINDLIKNCQNIELTYKLNNKNIKYSGIIVRYYENRKQIMIHNGHNVLLDIKNIVSIKILTD